MLPSPGERWLAGGGEKRGESRRLLVVGKFSRW